MVVVDVVAWSVHLDLPRPTDVMTARHVALARSRVAYAAIALIIGTYAVGTVTLVVVESVSRTARVARPPRGDGARVVLVLVDEDVGRTGRVVITFERVASEGGESRVAPTATPTTAHHQWDEGLLRGALRAHREWRALWQVAVLRLTVCGGHWFNGGFVGATTVEVDEAEDH